MFDLFAFLVIQIMVSLLVKAFSNVYWKGQFRAWSYLFFGILILLYPLTVPERNAASGHHYCGIEDAAMRTCLWIMGIPSVMLLQFLLNRFILKPIYKTNN